jgi:hypothetical protein
MALEGGLVDLGTLQKDRQGDIGVAAFEADVRSRGRAKPAGCRPTLKLC